MFCKPFFRALYNNCWEKASQPYQLLQNFSSCGKPFPSIWGYLPQYPLVSVVSTTSGRAAHVPSSCLLAPSYLVCCPCKHHLFSPGACALTAPCRVAAASLAASCSRVACLIDNGDRSLFSGGRRGGRPRRLLPRRRPRRPRGCLPRRRGIRFWLQHLRLPLFRAHRRERHRVGRDWAHALILSNR